MSNTKHDNDAGLADFKVRWRNITADDDGIAEEHIASRLVVLGCVNL